MILIAPHVFELAYYDFPVKQVSHYAISSFTYGSRQDALIYFVNDVNILCLFCLYSEQRLQIFSWRPVRSTCLLYF